MTTRAALLLALAGASLTTVAQEQRFEVVAIKPSKATDAGGRNDLQPGMYIGEGVTPRQLIALAYSPLSARQILGGPAWLGSERFDIRARFAGNVSRDVVQIMLRDMLSDRFHLATHVESRRTRALALVLARSGRLGPSLHRSTLDCARADGTAPNAPGVAGCTFNYHDGAIDGRGITIDQLASKLIAERVVVNRTALTGAFDVELRWTPTSATTPGDGAAPGLATALEDQLGLKLQGTTVPMDYVVIDHVERPDPD
ncbi:MAG TPA: TIGR03435 family protein [Vicinamibacterales bacterium]|nr:TIGR03435 family protein [Vicinamibacterales bacterium]